jgi:hypothetical protein
MSSAESPLDRARSHHLGLYQASIQLELALATPAASRAGWIAGVEEALVSLGHAVGDHVVEVEREGGLFGEIIARAPRLTHAVSKLRDEHARIEAEVVKALDDLKNADAGDDSLPARVRDDCLDLFVTIARHRHDSADLVYDAYDVDLGGGD